MSRRAAIVSIALAGMLVVSLLAALAAGAAPAVRAPPSATEAPSPLDAAPARTTSNPGAVAGPDISAYTVILPTGEVTGPAAGLIENADGAYSLDADVSGAIVDEFANSSFSGNGYTITSTTALGFAFDVNTTENVTVSDLDAGGSSHGVEVYNSTDISVLESTAVGTAAGFEIVDGTSIYLGGDEADNALFGFVANDSTTVTFAGDTATTDYFGYAGYYDSYFEVEYSDGGGDDYGASLVWGSYAEFYYDAFNDTVVYGIELEFASDVSVYHDWSVDSTYGLYEILSDYVYVEYSSFTGDIHDGASLMYSSDSVLDDDNFSDAGVVGAYVNHGSYNEVSYDAANFDAITGIFLGNQSDSQAWWDVADHDGWNGLEVADSDYVTSDYSSFNETRSATGNGSFVKTTTNGEYFSDYFGGDDVGLYGLGTQDLEAYGSNASNDNVSFYLLEDQAPFLLHDTAFDANATAVEISLTSGYDVQYFNATDAEDGITAFESSSGEVFGSTLRQMGDGGIVLELDTDTELVDNVILNSAAGLFFLATVGSYAFGNTVTNSTSAGAFFAGTEGGSLFENNISESAIGFEIAGGSDTNVSGNWFYADTDDFAIDADGVAGNVVAWNNFIDGGGWIFVYAGGTSNSVVFDQGYPGGGNYWSNHTGPDEFSGPDQNIPGPDGIVDTPMNISLPGNYTDHYPLARALDLENLTVEFVAEGLPGDAVWGIQFWDYPLYNTTDPEVDYFLGTAGWQNYSYAIHAPAGWQTSTSSGTVHFDGAKVVVDVVFTPVNYTVTFTQSSLPAGTAWSVTFDGETAATTGPSLAFSAPNGTAYSYRVDPPAGYVVSPSSGTLNVSGAPVTAALTFRAVTYSVTISQAGLAAGTSWSVTFDGVPETSTGATIQFSVPNGTYDYTIGNVSGYSVTPQTGSQAIAGPGASITVVYTANASSSSAISALDWALVALVIVLAIVVVLLLVRGRSKPASASGVSSWSPPPGANPPPAAPGPTPAVPPGAGGPPPPPDWKET